jgi:hypothetical protein
MDGVLNMPANKYTRSLYKPGTVASERAAIANRDPARKAAAMKIMAQEGTTSAAGGRPVAKMPAKPAAPKAKPVQVTRTTVAFKPTPAKKK